MEYVEILERELRADNQRGALDPIGKAPSLGLFP